MTVTVTDPIRGKIIDMEPLPFAKPPPANPLPLDDWLIRADRAEAGREAFFRGRDAEYEIFRSALTSFSKGTLGGGTMVFQGAPGTGKSALMAECMAAVRLHSTVEAPWVAVSINPHSLQSPVDVIETMVAAAHRETERLREVSVNRGATKTLDILLNMGKKLCRELSKRGGGAFGLSVGRNRNEAHTAGSVFRNNASRLEKYHIVVCVDEAQNIPISEMTRDVIDCLHRVSHGIPLLAAFFGLSDTQDVLRGGALSINEIKSIAESALDGWEETPTEFLNHALHVGLLAPAHDNPGHYQIPIPSFADYLKALPVAPT